MGRRLRFIFLGKVGALCLCLCAVGVRVVEKGRKEGESTVMRGQKEEREEDTEN